jgi:hypothetical protein
MRQVDVTIPGVERFPNGGIGNFGTNHKERSHLLGPPVGDGALSDSSASLGQQFATRR